MSIKWRAITPDDCFAYIKKGCRSPSRASDCGTRAPYNTIIYCDTHVPCDIITCPYKDLLPHTDRWRAVK